MMDELGLSTIGFTAAFRTIGNPLLFASGPNTNIGPVRSGPVQSQTRWSPQQAKVATGGRWRKFEIVGLWNARVLITLTSDFGQTSDRRSGLDRQNSQTDPSHR